MPLIRKPRDDALSGRMRRTRRRGVRSLWRVFEKRTDGFCSGDKATDAGRRGDKHVHFCCALVAGKPIDRGPGEGPSSEHCAAYDTSPRQARWISPDHDLPQLAGRCAGHVKGAPARAAGFPTFWALAVRTCAFRDRPFRTHHLHGFVPGSQDRSR